ncbi:putative phytanoyl- dioxygenase family protein [Rosellinia necatrix]|uniref:Putative phytanoyl-dioxygenase family protein n=1 Tax=Rosellinia necatrix TaxID=77044 RepID=A0A1W2TL77_ROSNE|nr:putative phytanoyl- dioxygenase family protein [Rosellinia necatrix]
MKALLEQCAAKIAAQRLNGIDQSFAGHRMIENSSPPIDQTCSFLSTVPSGHQASDLLRVPKSELLQYSQQLKPFIDDGRGFISKHYLSTARSVLPREVVGEMQKWMAIVNSKLFWVEGISSHASEPVLSTAALNICAIAQNSGIPCLSYFCTTIHERNKTARRDPNATHTEATCVSLLYSIIIQLCENLPDDFAGAEEFEHQFQLLDGTLKSLEAAICLIERLFICLPPLTVWVLDRFPFAGTKSTAPYIKRLIDILRSEGDGRITKVLFTTEGNTPWLSGNLRAHEHFLASRMALNKPGRVMPGAVSPVFHGKFPKDGQET